MKKKQLTEEILKGCRAVRRLRPLVHMIPNYVTAGICADAISAIGGRPLMASAPEEMEEITASADGLVINMGQPSEEKYRACRTAMETAAKSGLPVLFDPVGAGASAYRRRIAGDLTGLPWSGVIKGNSAEIRTVLTGVLSHDGVDSIREFENVTVSAEFFREMEHAGRDLVLASTGSTDQIFWSVGPDGQNTEIRLKHETERAVVMVGTGCIAGALAGTLMAAARLESGKPLGKEQMGVLTAAAISLAAFAGEDGLESVAEPQAGTFRHGKTAGSVGYGTYQVRFLDRLSRLNEDSFGRYLEKNMEMNEE